MRRLSFGVLALRQHNPIANQTGRPLSGQGSYSHCRPQAVVDGGLHPDDQGLTWPLQRGVKEWRLHSQYRPARSQAQCNDSECTVILDTNFTRFVRRLDAELHSNGIGNPRVHQINRALRLQPRGAQEGWQQRVRRAPRLGALGRLRRTASRARFRETKG